MHCESRYEQVVSGPSVSNKDSKAGLPSAWSFVRGVRLFVTALILAPGTLFGVLFVVFTPVSILEGRGTWLAVYPVTYAFLQAGSFFAWLFASPTQGLRRLAIWTVATVAGSVVLIAELQRQINEFDGECGNVLLGPMFMQIAACGTILGAVLLSFDRWSARAVKGTNHALP